MHPQGKTTNASTPSKDQIVLLPINGSHYIKGRLRHRNQQYHQHKNIFSTALLQNVTIPPVRFPEINETRNYIHMHDEIRIMMMEPKEDQFLTSPTLSPSSSIGHNSSQIVPLASFVVFLSMSFLRRIIRRRNRHRLKMELQAELNRAEAEASSDLIQAANMDYGSFSSPWTGDLDKFDV
jgi:C4-dicarboxylate-specific signal transduction histidine kinase